MIVACPKCDKKFKLDDEKLKAGPVKLKCTGCSTVFEVQAPKTQAALYRIRTQDGSEQDNVTLDDLKKKVLTGQLAPDDMVAGPGEPLSPAGERTEVRLPQAFRLDDAPRFERFFLVTADEAHRDALRLADVVERARRLARDPSQAERAELPDLPMGLQQQSLRVRKDAR